MTIDFTKSDSEQARSFYWAHGLLSQPTYRVIGYFKRWGNPLNPAVFDNYSTKTKELAYRAFGPAALVGAAAYLATETSLPFVGLLSLGGVMAMEGGRLALHLLAYSNQKKDYVHVRTSALEITRSNPKVMSWNILGFPAGMNYTCGGCIPLKDRFEGIKQLIEQEDPDILVIQECLIDASTFEMFISAFQGKYAHFFIHNGKNKLGTESGQMVITKCPVVNYTFTPFKNNDWTMTRGFTTLQINTPQGQIAVIGTHMESGSKKQDTINRTEQLAQIHNHAKQLTDVSAVVLAGDLNINAARPKEREETRLDEVLIGVHIDGEPTCTNEFNRLRYPHDRSSPETDEWVDQIALIKRSEADTTKKVVRDLKVIPVYNIKGKLDSKHALSDHNPMVATLDLS